jgi:hypothetical protein
VGEWVVLDAYFIVAIIFVDIFYFLGKARIEDVVIITSLGVLWITIRLVVVQSIIEKIEKHLRQVKCGEEK